ncbi:hypothetical protein BK653_06605 [Pseudomonas brassicacearum]|uniref:hypothetical protein n=1 Tax=Pseudomonas brassicacearum TaxID=930166 RepID=UPI000F486BB0|nr:hypothetical protein [Pseudomonas brassicacearum]ROM71546.1 hypothetical protein BK653_06605 [Pseudomonas brassicacearum]
MTMNIMKNLILGLLLGPVAVATSLANTAITVEIINNTSNAMEMTNVLTEVPTPSDFSLSAYGVPAKTASELYFVHDRRFTYPAAGWQPTQRKIKPIELVLSYQMSNFNFGCQMQTLFEAPIGFGILESSYRPNWKSRTAYTGNGEYTCRSEVSQKMLEPPFSYTVRLIIE